MILFYIHFDPFVLSDISPQEGKTARFGFTAKLFGLATLFLCAALLGKKASIILFY